MILFIDNANATENKMEITQSMIDRTARDWTEYAGEHVVVKNIKGTLYGFASELGTLRIYRKYMPHADNVTQGYSLNLNQFYFALTLKF